MNNEPWPGTAPSNDAEWISEWNQWQTVNDGYTVWTCGWCGKILPEENDQQTWYCMREACLALGVTSGLYESSKLQEDLEIVRANPWT